MLGAQRGHYDVSLGAGPRGRQARAVPDVVAEGCVSGQGTRGTSCAGAACGVREEGPPCVGGASGVTYWMGEAWTVSDFILVDRACSVSDITLLVGPALLGRDRNRECVHYDVTDAWGTHLGCKVDGITRLPTYVTVMVTGGGASCSDISVDLQRVEVLTPPMLTATCNGSKEAHVRWEMRSHFHHGFQYEMQINKTYENHFQVLIPGSASFRVRAKPKESARFSNWSQTVWLGHFLSPCPQAPEDQAVPAYPAGEGAGRRGGAGAVLSPPNPLGAVLRHPLQFCAESFPHPGYCDESCPPPGAALSPPLTSDAALSPALSPGAVLSPPHSTQDCAESSPPQGAVLSAVLSAPHSAWDCPESSPPRGAVSPPTPRNQAPPTGLRHRPQDSGYTLAEARRSGLRAQAAAMLVTWSRGPQTQR
ncbi:Interleukin-3 receptor subunit alpha [Lemmus lemmus]